MSPWIVALAASVFLLAGVLRTPIGLKWVLTVLAEYKDTPPPERPPAVRVLYQNKLKYIPKISIIVPVYNVEKYLRRCLNSLVNQTLQQIEIILINDGSTDNSLKILHEYAMRDNRITVLSQNNSGCSLTRNAGLNVAKGEYIWFVDADDWVEVNAAELTYKEAMKYNADIVCFHAKVHPVDDDVFVRTFDIDKPTQQTVDIRSLHFPDWQNVIFYTWNNVYRRSYIGDTRFERTLTWGEDSMFNLCLALNQAPLRVTIDKPLYHYLKARPGSATGIKDTTKRGLRTTRQILYDKNLKKYDASAQRLIAAKAIHFVPKKSNWRVWIFTKWMKLYFSKKELVSFETYAFFERVKCPLFYKESDNS